MTDTLYTDWAEANKVALAKLKAKYERPERETALTVRELIDLLQALPEEQMDWLVQSDGCDCTGDAKSIEVLEDGPNRRGYVLISRDG